MRSAEEHGELVRGIAARVAAHARSGSGRLLRVRHGGTHTTRDGTRAEYDHVDLGPLDRVLEVDASGRYAVAEAEYQYAPLRIFDLKPGLDGQTKVISRPIGAWTSDWKTVAHNMEVRWPYVFVSGYEEGLQVFNMMDPTNPYTVGFHDTFDGPHNKGTASTPTPTSNWTWGVYDGAFGVDVRNADGLIVIEDFRTGFWAFKMEGFDGWNGRQWGMPNISSVQDWDNGPDGAPKPQRVS